MPRTTRHKGVVMRAGEALTPLHQRLVDTVRAGDHAVDFLQSHEIRIDVIDQVGNSLQVDDLVHSLTVMDVVGQNAEGVGRCGCIVLGTSRLAANKKDEQ